MKPPFLKSFALLLFIPFYSLAQIQLEKRSLLDNKIEMLVPTYFKVMTPEMLHLKYPNPNQRPELVLTDDAAEVNIVANVINQPLQENQIGPFKDFQISSLKKSHPDAKWLANGLKKVNGKTVGYFKFISTAVDQTAFNYYFLTNMDGKILLFSFNCTEKLLPKWSDAAESIVSSLKIK